MREEEKEGFKKKSNFWVCFSGQFNRRSLLYMHLLNDIDGTNWLSIPFSGSFSSSGRELLVWKAASQGRRAARSSRPSAVAGWEGRRTPRAPAQACREAIWTGETHAEYLARPGAQL